MDKGQPMDDCPWKNPYAFRKQKPKPEIEAEARKIVGQKIEKN